MRVGYNVGFVMGMLLSQCMANRLAMGQCETLAVSNLLAHKKAIRSLI